MFNLFLIIFIFAELSFYLLIAQTGVMEILHSQLKLIVFLPLGGILGTFLSAKIKLEESYKVGLFLSLQLISVVFYPEFNPLLLFLLGLGVGGISPFIIRKLRFATPLDFFFSLSASYAFSTFLFTSDPYSRELLAVGLSTLALFGYIFSLNLKKSENISAHHTYPLFIMLLWVVLDSSLFETLSRDSFISIWRDGYSLEIIFFHIVGVLAALSLKLNKQKDALIIALAFLFSYIFYFTKEALLLSIVYPFVISYYNVVILQSLVQVKELKTVAFYMVWIGWIASGVGLGIALSGFISFVPMVLVVLFVQQMQETFYLKKGVKLW